MKNTVDPKPDASLVPSWFKVNITGALGKRIVQQPIHDVDDVRVVRLHLFDLAEL